MRQRQGAPRGKEMRHGKAQGRILSYDGGHDWACQPDILALSVKVTWTNSGERVVSQRRHTPGAPGEAVVVVCRFTIEVQGE